MAKADTTMQALQAPRSRAGSASITISLPRPGQSKTISVDDSAADQHAQMQADDGHDRHQRVAQRVHATRPWRPGMPLARAGADVSPAASASSIDGAGHARRSG